MTDTPPPRPSGGLLGTVLSWNPLELILKATPIIFFLILIVVLGLRLGSIEGNDDILKDLSDPGVARGLITGLPEFPWYPLDVVVVTVNQ
ncbi:MAG: hypothetical protein AAGA83_14695, partial [Cyanobacteria bacterium P01_F01_bin.116]